jgi:hypothetical protein
MVDEQQRRKTTDERSGMGILACHCGIAAFLISAAHFSQRPKIAWHRFGTAKSG